MKQNKILAKYYITKTYYYNGMHPEKKMSRLKKEETKETPHRTTFSFVTYSCSAHYYVLPVCANSEHQNKYWANSDCIYQIQLSVHLIYTHILDCDTSILEKYKNTFESTAITQENDEVGWLKLKLNFLGSQIYIERVLISNR